MMCTNANSRVARVQKRFEIHSYFICPHSSPKVAVKAFRFGLTLKGEGADKSARVIVSIRLITSKINLTCLADFSERTRNMEKTKTPEYCSAFGNCSWLWNTQFHFLGVIVDAQRNCPEFLNKL